MQNFIKLKIFLVLITLAGCSANNPMIDQLKNEVLSMSCDNEYKNYLENQINRQRMLLNDRQMINSLQNMKRDIKCVD